jgi:hypothetical protein
MTVLAPKLTGPYSSTLDHQQLSYVVYMTFDAFHRGLHGITIV